jgi:hypothetical protein
VAAEVLLRVTAGSGARRVDVAVPGAVPVAELIPELARAVGLLDPAAAYAGYRVTALGRRLLPDRALVEQGVEDGALLTISARADEPPATVHDDIAEAMAEVVAGRRPWGPADTRRAAQAVGMLLGLLGLTALTAHVTPRLSGSVTVPGAGADPSVVAAVVLVLAVLAGNGLPVLALTVSGARADRLPVRPADVAERVRRAARLLLAASAGLGLLVVVTVPPVVARGTTGTLLAADACLVLLLRARQHRRAAQLIVDACGAIAGLVALVGTVLVVHPDARLPAAAALGGCAAVVAAVSRMPPPPPALRGRVGDLLETGFLVALPPLLLIATDGLAAVAG